MYDIVIIGNGPAASTFARCISTKYKKVAIINFESKNHKPCGGLLSPDAQKCLAMFDLTLPKDILVSPQIFSVKVLDLNTKITRYYQRYYLNMDRSKFDKYLYSLINDNIEKINDRVLEIKKEKDYFKLKLSNKTLKSKYIIGADGASGITRNTFIKKKIDSYLAVQEWYKIDNKTSEYSCIFDKETSNSCSWTLNKDDYFIYGGCFNKTNGIKDFNKQKEKLSKYLNINLNNPVKKESCLVNNPKSYFDFQTGKDGVYLIGEAAGFISASSYEGISNAISSAAILAEVFNKYNDPKKITKHYKLKSIKLKLKLTFKIFKKKLIFNELTRNIIMKSNITSIKKYKK